MKVNPQIAATLAVPGGAPLAPVPTRPTVAPKQPAEDDLLGGLSGVGAPAEAHGGDGQQQQQAWDAFGEATAAPQGAVLKSAMHL